MAQTTDDERPDEYYAKTYDDSVQDWPGELDFYTKLVKANPENVLEIASGTGRIALRLSKVAKKITGIDLSSDMINEAVQKSTGLANIRWVQADMRNFDLGERFGLILIPGHSFQNLRTPQDQVACLTSIKKHLKPNGVFVMHLDHMNLENMMWLGRLCGEERGVLKKEGEFIHPETGKQVHALNGWIYAPATQTATILSLWEEYDNTGKKIRRIEREPIPLHAIFPFEVEHLLARVGFEIETVYGDFYKSELTDSSPSMIWVAKKKG